MEHRVLWPCARLRGREIRWEGKFIISPYHDPAVVFLYTIAMVKVETRRERFSCSWAISALGSVSGLALFGRGPLIF